MREKLLWEEALKSEITIKTWKNIHWKSSKQPYTDSFKVCHLEVDKKLEILEDGEIKVGIGRGTFVYKMGLKR